MYQEASIIFLVWSKKLIDIITIIARDSSREPRRCIVARCHRYMKRSMLMRYLNKILSLGWLWIRLEVVKVSRFYVPRHVNNIVTANQLWTTPIYSGSRLRPVIHFNECTWFMWDMFKRSTTWPIIFNPLTQVKHRLSSYFASSQNPLLSY